MCEIAGEGTAAQSPTARTAQRYAWRLFFCIGVAILRNHCDNLMNKPSQRIGRDSSR